MAFSPLDFILGRTARTIIKEGKEALNRIPDDSGLGIAKNTIFGLNKTALETIVQPTIRGVGNLGQLTKTTIQAPFTGKAPTSKMPASQNPLTQKFYGTDKSFSFTSENEEFLNTLGVKKGTPASKVLSPVVGFGLTLSDAFGGSGRGVKTVTKEMLKVLSKSQDVPLIQRTLKTIGLSDKAIKDISPVIKNLSDENQINKLINQYQPSVTTPNVSRSGATREINQPQPSRTSETTTQNLYSEELPISREMPELSYDQSMPFTNKKSSGNKFYNEQDQIYREMTDPDSFPIQRSVVKELSTNLDIPRKVPEYKDIGNISKGFRDIWRNVENVFGADAPAIKQNILDPLDDSKGAFIQMQKTYLDDLNKNIVQGLGIKKGSKESAWLQKFGEGRVKYADVVKELGEAKARDIVQANNWFRSKYDELLDRVNQARKEIYPNDPGKIIPKRQDYFRHFRDLEEDLSGLKNIFETPAGIDPTLAGLSPFTKPKSKWLSFAQRRIGNKTDEDAVGGFLNYLPSASYAVHIDKNIGNFRALAENLAQATKDTGNLNNFIDYLNKYANSLSGKTNDFDRNISDFFPGGRRALRVLDWLNKRVKANTILGNVSSSVAQIFNVPQGIASAKQYSAPGFVRTVGGLFKPNIDIPKSSFLAERYFRGYDKFEEGMLKDLKQFAVWMTGVLDEVGTKFIWNSHYEKALAENIKNPIRYADDMTRKLVAGRGVGEVPLMQQSKIFQIAAPFQLEVANLWNVMADFKKKKDFTAFAILFLTSYIMNRVAEKVRGSAVTFDPVQAALDAAQAFKNADSFQEGAIRAGGRLAGEGLSNLPFGQTLASVYDEHGGGFMGSVLEKATGEKITRKELFGRGDPTRFGSGILAVKSVQDPLYKLIPPFGGAQAKKTLEGLAAIKAGASFDQGGNKQFNVGGNLLKNIQAGVFGKYANKEARDYFAKKEGRAPKSEADKLIEKKKEAEEVERARVKRIYFEVQRLKFNEKNPEAAADLIRNLPPEDLEIYKSILKSEKTKSTQERIKKMQDTVVMIQNMKKEGNIDGARAIISSFTQQDLEDYKKAKENLGL